MRLFLYLDKTGKLQCPKLGCQNLWVEEIATWTNGKEGNLGWRWKGI